MADRLVAKTVTFSRPITGATLAELVRVVAGNLYHEERGLDHVMGATIMLGQRSDREYQHVVLSPDVQGDPDFAVNSSYDHVVVKHQVWEGVIIRPAGYGNLSATNTVEKFAADLERAYATFHSQS